MGLSITITLDAGRGEIDGDGRDPPTAERVTLACHQHTLRGRFPPPEATLLDYVPIFQVEGREVELVVDLWRVKDFRQVGVNSATCIFDHFQSSIVFVALKDI